MSAINKLQEQILKQRRELQELEEKLELAKQEDPVLAFARDLHDMTCHHNHIDGCGWHYESRNGQEDWNGHAHGQYLTKARNLIAMCKQHKITTDAALEIYKVINQ